MSGTCCVHVCKQATNMMVNMPSSFASKWRIHNYEHVQNILMVHTRAQLAVTVDMSDEEELLLAAAATVVICGYRHKRLRWYWVRPSLKLGNEHRESLYKKMMLDDEGLLPQHISDSRSFRNFLRMYASDLGLIFFTSRRNCLVSVCFFHHL